MDRYLGKKSLIGETVIPIKKKKAEETKEKVSKEKNRKHDRTIKTNL